jgi:cytochrome c oxidase cbb3-type subunit 3
MAGRAGRTAQRRRGKRLAVLGMLAAIAAASLALAGCQREQRRLVEPAPSSGLQDPARLTELQAGPPRPPGPARPAVVGIGSGPYAENAWAVSQGKRLYTWFNCHGCHAQGGGDIGPALMDAAWIYGDAPSEVYASIVQGRPNGMPSYGGKIPDAQVWWLVAYVRSMSGQLRKDVRPGRDDHMQRRPSEQSTPREPPVRATGGGEPR